MKAILTYHSIDDSGSPISVSEDAFEAHLRWLRSGSVSVLPLCDLIGHSADAADAVAITFDDGFLNAGRPIERLLDAGLPATIFVVTGHVGRTNAWGGRQAAGIPTLPLLDWGRLHHLRGLGASVEAHTCSHRALHRLSPDAIDAELEGCRVELRDKLGADSSHLAYPYGHLSDGVVERAARVFKFGHTTAFRMMRSTEDAMRLPRIDAYYFRRPRALESWGSPGFSRRMTWIRLRRTVRAWARR